MSDILVIRKVLLHSIIPIIKADILKSGLIARGVVLPSEEFSDNDIYVSIDISIDCPGHSGLATAEFVKQMLLAYPTLGPVVNVLKTFLKVKVRICCQIFIHCNGD